MPTTSYNLGPSLGASAAAPGVMDRLRTETADLHSAAESHAFQRSLVNGGVTREGFARWITLMLPVHEALERAVRALRDADPRVAALVDDAQFRAGDLRADLAFFGGAGGGHGRVAELAAGEIDDAAARPAPDRLAVLGMHYVLEGSLNGNRFIAMALRKSLDIAGPDGLRHLDPYGAAQRERWQAFKTAMSAQAWTRAEEDAMVDGAKWMFNAVGRLSEAMTSTNAV